MYEALTSGKTETLTVQSPFATPQTDGTTDPTKSRKAHVKEALWKILSLRFHEGLAELFAGLPASRHGVAREHQQNHDIDPEHLRNQQRALEADDDPVRWAREARDREQHELDADGEDDWEALGLGGRDSDVLESIGIIAIIVSVG